MTAETETRTALCDRFTKSDGKRGKPARDSKCAVCEMVWTEHFSEKDPDRGQQQPVLHPEHVRVIPEPKRKRRPRAVVEDAVRKVANKVADFIDPGEETYSEEPHSDPEPEPEPVIDRMECGHLIDQLQTVDGEEACQQCKRAVALWEHMRNWSIEREMERTGKTREEATADYDRDCEDW